MKLTVLDKFHSHLEDLNEINKNDIHKQVKLTDTFSIISYQLLVLLTPTNKVINGGRI